MSQEMQAPTDVWASAWDTLTLVRVSHVRQELKPKAENDTVYIFDSCFFWSPQQIRPPRWWEVEEQAEEEEEKTGMTVGAATFVLFLMKRRRTRMTRRACMLRWRSGMDLAFGCAS